MAGVNHDPIADIQLITDNLRDRYKTGFPILKEIVQNADDAGSTHLSIGYSAGLVDAEHELLKGPAVFFVNDGPFTKMDAQAILSIALGSKASKENAIGKFGLGMKSLFHLCEAFFFLSDQWNSGEDFHSNIFNPWARYREQWEDFSYSDKERIQQYLHEVVNALADQTEHRNWFIVWVPLRKRRSKSEGSIIEYYPGDENEPPDFITDNNIGFNLGQLLPLLKGLTSLSIWQPNDSASANLHCTSNIVLSDDTIRRQFHAPILESKLSGKVMLKSAQEHHQIQFAGFEKLLPDGPFHEIRNSEFWPRSYERNEHTGRETQIQDKAKPHAAIVVCQTKAAHQACCYNDWAVFLPLGFYPQTERSYWINPDDKYHTQVFIHGYFFIDAGRVHIHGLDKISEPLTLIENDEQVRSQWNSLLATEGCLSYLPLAVKNFVEAHNCGAERTQHLSEAIFKSDFIKPFRKWVSYRYQWLCQLKINDKSWQLIPADTHPLALPLSPKGEQNRAWSVLPKLDRLSEQGYVFYDQSLVHVLNEQHNGWDDDLLLEVLNIDVSRVFCERTWFTYLNEFLTLEEVKKTKTVTDHLFHLARDGLKLASDKLAKSEVTRFLEFIPVGQRVVINKVEKLWAQLANVQTRSLIVPKAFVPESEKVTPLLLEDAKLLLQTLDNVLGNDSLQAQHNEAQALVCEIIERVAPKDKERLISECGNLRLFKVFDLAKGKNTFLAKSALLQALNTKTLFRFQSGLSDERFGFGKELSKALESCNIFYIDTSNFNLAFGKSHNISFCDAKACLNYIDIKKPVLSRVKDRTELVSKLAVAGDLTVAEKRAFRYVLHANLDYYGSDQALLAVETHLNDAVWQTLAQAIYQADRDNWRLVDQVLINDLSHKVSSMLDVSSLGNEQILLTLAKRFEQINFQSLQLEQDERETILAAIEDENLWKSLPFHNTLTGERVTISEQCYLDNDVDIPAGLESQFIRIKISSDQNIAKQQSQWIRPLKENALIEIILNSAKPDQYYQCILDQLDDLNLDDLDDDLLRLLKQTNWLITKQRQDIKPEDVIAINGLEDEVKRLTAECNAGYFVPEDVHQDIGGHPAYDKLTRLFSHESDGLECLLLMLGESEAYAIGSLLLKVNELLEFAGLVADDLDFDGWKILANKQVQSLLKESDENLNNPLEPLLKPLSEDRYLSILEHLKACHQRISKSSRPKILKLFNAYLALFARCLNAQNLLKEFELFSQSGSWVAASKLCVGVTGIADDALLDKEQAGVLQAMIFAGAQQRTEKNPDVIADESLLLQSTPGSLQAYFRDWEGRVESELIGFFISLLGGNPEVKQVAQQFLGKRTPEGVRNEIGWQVQTKNEPAIPLFNGLDQHEAIKKMVFLISVESGEKIQVNSIFNEPIEVFLHKSPSSIVINHRFLGQYKVSFQLRKLNFIDWNESNLSNLLRNSAEFILKTVYEQACSLDKVWANLGESDQLDIAIARSLILEELPTNLKQLRIQQSELKQFLQCRDEARNEREELKLTTGDTKKADQEIQETLQKMQKLLLENTETQTAVLHAIKDKVKNHQYQLESIPFELFQNADDAVFEYAEMLAYPSTSDFLNDIELDEQHCQFQLIEERGCLLFVHWGRAINYFRGSEGFPGKERGFHRDLEKMLLLNTSDKQAENQVTGKFGLGFKSVYLVSDKPKILSGRLGVEIFAAMLPESLKEQDRSRLKNTLDSLSVKKITATAIELPLADDIEQDEVLKTFKCYAGILVVFSKVIKSILVNEKGQIAWREQPVLESLPEIRKGSVLLNDKKVDALKFVFKHEHGGDLLFAFGATGFESFPRKIEQVDLPKIWILAPTHDLSAIGFIVNAGFDVDMGRLQLAHQSIKNDQIMCYLGKNLAIFAERLDSVIQDDWQSFRAAFDLASDVTPYSFWESFWAVLVSSWVRSDDNKVHQLVRAMLTSEQSCFIELLTKKALIPSGLWGDYQQLLCLQNIQFVLKGLLTQDQFFRQMHDQLISCVHENALVHDNVRDELYKLLPEDQKKDYRWVTFDLVTLAEKIFANKRVDMKVAALWGDFFSDDVLQELDKTEERKKEKQRLEKVLSDVQFLNNEQKFKLISDLLDGQYAYPEEKLRAGFAPETFQLSRKYDEKAAYFFRFSRPQMKAPIEQMKQWALTAPNLSKQKGVLDYLLKGEKSDELATLLRPVKKGTWLEILNEASEHFVGWSKTDKNTVLKRKLPSDEVMEQLKLNIEDDAQEQQILNPEIVLNNIYNWWARNKEVYLGRYSRNIYPEGIFPELFNKDNELNRDSWMTLLFLASLHTVGRTQDVQHRDAIKSFKNKGWWSVFIQENPQEAPGQWMKVLDDYLQDQFYGSQYEAWMMRFVTIYRFARWLDEYADSWLSIKQQPKKFSLEDVLNTVTSSVHAGGGVSAPRLSRTLGIGANFMLRELVRNGVLNSASAIICSEHCFVPHLRVRQLFNQLGMTLDRDYADINQSQKIYDFISYHLGKEKATFDLCFDIPFQCISRDLQLQLQLFSNTPIKSNFVPIDGLMDSPAWAWDLLENIPFFVNLVIENDLPEPIVGYELFDSDGHVLLELELSWEANKVGIVIGEEYECLDQIQVAQSLGWQVFTAEELEEELDQFLKCFTHRDTV